MPKINKRYWEIEATKEELVNDSSLWMEHWKLHNIQRLPFTKLIHHKGLSQTYYYDEWPVIETVQRFKKF